MKYIRNKIVLYLLRKSITRAIDLTHYHVKALPMYIRFLEDQHVLIHKLQQEAIDRNPVNQNKKQLFTKR